MPDAVQTDSAAVRAQLTALVAAGQAALAALDKLDADYQQIPPDVTLLVHWSGTDWIVRTV